MKSIFGLFFVLILGFAIGSFTNKGSEVFSFLKSGVFGQIEKNQITNTDELTLNAREALNKITESAQKETGVVFDKKYLDAMIVSYESSVALSKVATIASGHNEIRTLAKGVSKDDAAVLAQLKKWRAEWYPENIQNEKNSKEPPFVKK